MIPKKKKSLALKKPPLKKITRFRVRIRSRHPSHSPLRTQLPLLPFRSIVRLGSTTVKPVDSQRTFVECNSVEAIRNSSNKLRMKRCFKTGQVQTAKYESLEAFVNYPLAEREKYYPVVTKSHNGSRGKGNVLHDNEQHFQGWLQGKDVNNYIVEKFHDYSREYRLHVTKDGCFYTCRKMLKNETPEDKRWFRNDSNSTWIMENNPAFNKPVNWDEIVSECVKALVSVGLDVGACDVKVQSAKDKKGNPRTKPEFIIIEINSAPSFGDVTLQHYMQVIPQILKSKKA